MREEVNHLALADPARPHATSLWISRDAATDRKYVQVERLPQRADV